MKRLTALELSILGLLESDASQTFRELASRLKVKEFSVRRRFQRLVDRGVVKGKSVYIDTFHLGYIELGMYFGTALASAKDRQRFVSELNASPIVRWFADVGGDFDYSATFLVRDVREVRSFLEHIGGLFHAGIGHKVLALRSFLVRFPRYHLGAAVAKQKPLTLGESAAKPSSWDPLDRQILRALSHAGFKSTAQLAKDSGVPVATFSRRVQRLKEVGILKGTTYRIDARMMGFESYRLLLSFRELAPGIRGALTKLCKELQYVRVLVESLGSWDYELELELDHGRRVKEISGALHQAFPGLIQEIRVIPVFEHIKYVGVP